MRLGGHAQRVRTGTIARVAAGDTFKNVASLFPGFRRIRVLWPRAAPGQINDAWVDRHAFRTLEYVKRSGTAIAGKDVAEIGVGDTLASGLAFLAAGARSYTAIDPFLGPVGSARSTQIYEHVRVRWANTQQLPWPDDLDVKRFPDDRVRVLRCPIEQVPSELRFDVVCSVSVLEHVWNLHDVGRAMWSILEVGGVALHWTDLGPHGRWEQFDDKLTFLRVPDAIWRLGQRRGLPTRYRLDEIVAALQHPGLRVACSELGQFEDAQLPPDARRMARRFRATPGHVLRTSSALVALTRVN